MFVFSSHSENTTLLATPLTSFKLHNGFDSNFIISKVIFKKRLYLIKNRNWFTLKIKLNSHVLLGLSLTHSLSKLSVNDNYTYVSLTYVIIFRDCSFVYATKTRKIQHRLSSNFNATYNATSNIIPNYFSLHFY